MGNTSLTEAVPLRAAPAHYAETYSKIDLKKNIPVGSMVLKNRENPETRIVPPTQNGRGLSHPPADLAPRTSERTVPNPEHPYADRMRSLPPRPERAPEKAPERRGKKRR